MNKKNEGKKYRDTLNLPRTGFAMKANLLQREPEIQKRWAAEDLYGKIRQVRSGRPKRVLHDGPPYATGDLHVGTGLNKILKDFVVRYWTMRGFDSPYRPGWDCHGLPIEHRVDQELGREARNTPTIIKRKKCHKYALRFLDRNRKDFKRLGIFGQWDTPYLTVNHEYEAGVLDVFADMVEGGYVYRALRPVHWCFHCGTALAEAELEYADATSPSVYVRFPMADDPSSKFGIEPAGPVDCLIWTTTPWTLPANLAIALGPRARYALLEYADPKTNETRRMILADDLVNRVCEKTGIKTHRVLGVAAGSELAGLTYHHAWIDRVSPIVLADYVTLEDGSGCVHTAPGHGREDFLTGQQNGLETLSPVDDTGRLTDQAAPYAGQVVFDADPKIIAALDRSGALLHTEEFSHSYPHCWRCHQPVIFRATEQWFVNVDHQDLRKRMLSAIDRIEWVPGWGESRIRAMVEQRPDWCISRQRDWGVPIPGFYCRKCGRVLLDARVIRHIRDLFAQHGADTWFDREPKELLPAGTTCPDCGGDEFVKENDIFDVWFESGVSHRAVLRQDANLGFPCHTYLEGSDQHRGWFQVSLITAMAAEGKPPFSTVVTHGFVVDDKGEKMSKSRGNFIATSEATKAVGADIFRLWVASVDFRDDIPTSLDALKRISEGYRRIRNTLRYLLGNTHDFDPGRDAVPPEGLLPIDRWAVNELHTVARQVIEQYEKYQFHRVFSLLHNFCAVQMSSFYLDVLKDRLYCDGADWPSRRSAQTVMQEIAETLTLLIAPILVHTAEEAFGARQAESSDADSVHLARLPDPDTLTTDAACSARWDRLLKVRSDVLRTIEPLRKSRTIGSGLQAAITIYTQDEDLLTFMKDWGEAELSTLFISSTVSLSSETPPDGAVPGESEPALTVLAAPTSHPRCPRCWRHLPDLADEAGETALCPRCAKAVKQE